MAHALPEGKGSVLASSKGLVRYHGSRRNSCGDLHQLPGDCQARLLGDARITVTRQGDTTVDPAGIPDRTVRVLRLAPPP